MVKPSRFQLRGKVKVAVAVVEFEEPVHLGLHLLRRAVFMDMAIPPTGIVWSNLPFAPSQWDLHPVAERVNSGCRRLVTREQGVPFLDRRTGQRAFVLDVGEQHLESCLLVQEQALQRSVVDVGGRMRTAHTLETFGDQRFSYAPPQKVEPLNLAGLDGEGTVLLPDPDIHGAPVDRRILKPPAHIGPSARRLPRALMHKTVQGRIKISDPSPDGADRLRSLRCSHYGAAFPGASAGRAARPLHVKPLPPVFNVRCAATKGVTGTAFPS